MRTVRLVRVFRIFKLGRYNSSATLMYKTIIKSAQPLSILAYFLVIGIILFSSAMYYIEKDQNPESSEPFESIPAAMWWSIVTMTTVGYGDIYPTTTLGKFLASITMLCGIVVMALPISLIGSTFVEEVGNLAAVTMFAVRNQAIAYEWLFCTGRNSQERARNGEAEGSGKTYCCRERERNSDGQRYSR